MGRTSARLLYASKLKAGDLTVVSDGNDYVNVYIDKFPLSFLSVVFKAVPGDTGLILSRLQALGEEDKLHPQYVRVLFSRGVVGVIRASTLDLIV